MRGKAHIGSQHKLETTSEGKAMHGCNHRDLQFAPLPDDVLHEIGKAMRAFAQIRKWQQRFAIDDCRHPLDIEAGAKASALA